jgi:hypothetical protein
MIKKYGYWHGAWFGFGTALALVAIFELLCGPHPNFVGLLGVLLTGYASAYRQSKAPEASN